MIGRWEPGFVDVHGMHCRGYFLCLILKHGACSPHMFTCAKLREPCSNGDPSIHNIFPLRPGREQQRLCHKESARHHPLSPSPLLLPFFPTPGPGLPGPSKVSSRASSISALWLLHCELETMTKSLLSSALMWSSRGRFAAPCPTLSTASSCDA